MGDWDGLKAFNFGRDIGNELVAIKIRVVAAVNEQVNELGGLFGIGIEEKFADKFGFLGIEFEDKPHVEETQVPCRIEIDIATMRVAMEDDREVME